MTPVYSSDDDAWADSYRERRRGEPTAERCFVATRVQQSSQRKYAAKARHRRASKAQACNSIHRRGARHAAW